MLARSSVSQERTILGDWQNYALMQLATRHLKLTRVCFVGIYDGEEASEEELIPSIGKTREAPMTTILASHGTRLFLPDMINGRMSVLPIVRHVGYF